ncbi:MAG TPA: FHA domain-containing protein [Anaeromyxobacteraceae bacterium]|nr:FHA domain-containing protein [Anaeromyxobacteraceae bacterium]
MGRFPKCPRCGRENDPSFSFCLDCGQALKPLTPAPAAGRVCGGCGTALHPGFRFCGNCGRPVAAPAPTERPLPPGSEVGAQGEADEPRPERPGGASTAAPPPTGLRLTAMRHDGVPGAVFPLDHPEVICGRTSGEIRLGDDATVSPRHVRFVVRDGAVRAEDLGSVNGTFVRLRAPRTLTVGEELRVGRQLLRLEPLPRPAHPDDRGVRPWGAKDLGCRYRLTQLLEGGGLGEIFPLRPGENLVGREAGEVTFPSDRYVSARHARIDVSGAEVLLTDLGSSNGTFVKAIGAVDLAPGDQLLVGSQLLRLDG